MSQVEKSWTVIFQVEKGWTVMFQVEKGWTVMFQVDEGGTVMFQVERAVPPCSRKKRLDCRIPSREGLDYRSSK